MGAQMFGFRRPRFYRSQDGRHDFAFEFVERSNGNVDIYCRQRPKLRGRDSCVTKTHVFGSGKLCFVAGREPRSRSRAEQLAAQWAEYYLEYGRTGIAQS